MTATDAVFAGSVPAVYDELLVPLIFEGYARDIARRVAALSPDAVLEIAAGTGALTRELVHILPQGTRLVATDLNQAMLDRAAARESTPGRVEWRQADAMALPFADASADVVVCQFGAMFFPDRVHAYGEVRRVLRPGGHFLFNVWDSMAENPLTDVVARAVYALFPDDPPKFIERTPHGYHDAETIRADLAAAGFAGIAVEKLVLPARCERAETVARAFTQGTPLRGEIEARDSAGLERATRAAAEAVTARFGPGPVEAPIAAKVASAARPG